MLKMVRASVRKRSPWVWICRLVVGCLVVQFGCTPDLNRPPNIILVSIDTLRADRVGRLGPDGKSITPNLDALAAQSLVFERAYSASNESLYSHAAMFTGRLPTTIAALDYRNFKILADTPTLAGALKAHGYATHAAVGGGHLSSEFGLDEGFDSYLVGDNFSGFRQTMPMAMQRLSVQAKQEDPFFLFIHSYDCHAPYIKPGPAGRVMTPGYDGRFLELAAVPMLYEQIYKEWYAPDFKPHLVKGAGEADFISTVMFQALIAHIEATPQDERITLTDADRAFLVGTYDAAAMYADMWVGVLLRRMEELGLDENTVLMVVSDHGEELLDHGFFNHRAGLWDENIQVPLMMRGPGIPSGTRSEPVSLMDVASTLLARVQAPGPLEGLDLLDRTTIRPLIVSEGANGDLSARGAAATLIVPGGLSLDRPVPDLPPQGAMLMGADGEALPWSAEVVRPMWEEIAETR